MANFLPNNTGYIRDNYRKTGGHIDYGYVGIAAGKVTIVINTSGLWWTQISTSVGDGGCGEIVSVGLIMVQLLQGCEISGSVGQTAGGGGVTGLTDGVVPIYLTPFQSGASGGGGYDYKSIWGIYAMAATKDGDGSCGSMFGTCLGRSAVLQYCLFVVSR